MKLILKLIQHFDLPDTLSPLYYIKINKISKYPHKSSSSSKRIVSHAISNLHLSNLPHDHRYKKK